MQAQDEGLMQAQEEGLMLSLSKHEAGTPACEQVCG